VFPGRSGRRNRLEYAYRSKGLFTRATTRACWVLRVVRETSYAELDVRAEILFMAVRVTGAVALQEYLTTT
jgi:hypothetical protein